MFLFSFIIPTLNWALGLSKLVVAESVSATASNIVANQALFRVGIAVELAETAAAMRYLAEGRPPSKVVITV